MESKSGSLLALIAGIISFIIIGGPLLYLIFGIMLLTVPIYRPPTISYGVISPFILLMIMIIILLVFGILFILAYNWMKNPKTTRKGAILALILGIFSLPSIILGALGIISGILGLNDSKK